jgi:predicted transcriptional regulator
MPETTLLRLRLPQDLKVRLDRLAEATWTSASALTEEALAAYVDEQERMPKIRELGYRE